MTAIQTRETTPRDRPTYGDQVERARDRLQALGYSVLAVTGPDDSLGHILATEIGLADIEPHDDLPAVLAASSSRGNERRVAGVLPYYVAGEGYVSLREGEDDRVLDAIGANRNQQIARVDVPYEDTYVAMAIIGRAT